MTRLLITGVSGLLGINLALEAIAKGYEVVGWTNTRQLNKPPFEQKAVNMEDLLALPGEVEKAHPDAVINCAAIANLDVAEKDPVRAEIVNAKAPSVLADTAKKIGIPMLHISTDSVFDGKKGDYKEYDKPNPLNIYAQTKHNGEIELSHRCDDALIARVVFYGWSIDGRRSLAEFFYNNLSQGKQVNGFIDSIFNPLYVRDLASLLLEVLEADLHGIYHFFSRDRLSKYDFGVAFAKRFGFYENLINPIKTEQGGLQTRRPLNLSMNSEKLQEALGHDMPGIKEGLDRMFEDSRNGFREQLAGYLG
jgi:dTDP-4-dehydrorhamnose reductase